MADTDVIYYAKFQGGSALSNPIVHLCPYDLVKVTLKMLVDAASEMYIGCLGECIQESAGYGDLEDITMGGDENNTIMYQVLDTLDNIKQLKIDNNTYIATKLLTFSAGSYIDVVILVPGMIIEVVLALAEDADVRIGLMLYTADYGKVKLDDTTLCDELNNVGKALCGAAVSTADEYIIIMVTW